MKILLGKKRGLLFLVVAAHEIMRKMLLRKSKLKEWTTEEEGENSAVGFV